MNVKQTDEDMSVGGGAVSMPSFPLGTPAHKNNNDPIFKRKDWALFTVKSETFAKFETGRNRYERWHKYLDDDIEEERNAKAYAKKNPGHTIVLRNGDTGALRQIRRRAINQ